MTDAVTVAALTTEAELLQQTYTVTLFVAVGGRLAATAAA